MFTTGSTGTYAIGNDGTGSVSFDNALGTIHLAVTLVSSSKAYLVEGDKNLNGGGLAEKQDLTAIASAPSGTFVFREHDINALQFGRKRGQPLPSPAGRSAPAAKMSNTRRRVEFRNADQRFVQCSRYIDWARQRHIDR